MSNGLFYHTSMGVFRKSIFQWQPVTYAQPLGDVLAVFHDPNPPLTLETEDFDPAGGKMVAVFDTEDVSNVSNRKIVSVVASGAGGPLVTP